jgi:copper chaperone
VADTLNTVRPLPWIDNGGGCACCTPADTAIAPPEQDSAPAQITAFGVEGMTCSHCAKRVTDASNILENVSDAQVQLVPAGSSTVTVATDRLLLPSTVRTAIEEAGYTVSGS